MGKTMRGHVRNPHEEERLNKGNSYLNKSLIVTHLRSGDVLNQCNFSSKKYFGFLKSEIKEEEKSINQISKIDSNFECAYFEYRNEKTGLKITHRINLSHQLRSKI
ncbi:hypothetical protein DMUE_5988 [Dictyocoela muelleri]|nr:hypothetical protein DMUE_5988 [Dictyocoela muelleri]